MTETFLVTGASGFLGLNILEQLLSQGHTAIGISRDSIPQPARTAFAPLAGRLVEIEADLSRPFDFGPILQRFRPDVVISAAAVTPADHASPKLARTAIDLNVVASQRLLEAARDNGVRCVFQPSSASIYGAQVFGARPLVEDETGAPESLYAFTKYTIERLALSFGREYGLSVIAGRISSLFGPWERDTGVRDLLSPHLQLAGLASRGAAALLEDDARRDWTYARDAARVIVALAENVGPNAEPGLFNISCGKAWAFTDWADRLAGLYPGFRWRAAAETESASISYHGPRGVARRPLETARLQSVAAGSLMRPVDEALREYAEWLADGSGNFPPST